MKTTDIYILQYAHSGTDEWYSIKAFDSFQNAQTALVEEKSLDKVAGLELKYNIETIELLAGE
jgi:hypothetical protein